MEVSVRVTIAYRNDPERVRDVLAATAGACAGIAAAPAAQVLLDAFAENGFEFLVRATADGAVPPDEAASTLRFAIVKAFRADQIEFAVPQSDVRWRDLDFIRQAFSAALAQRSAVAGNVGDEN